MERLIQLEDFKHILSRNPEVQDLQQAGINVNYSGLAQHYGIETHIMDLTNSFGVAAFFATSRYDALTGSYTPIRDCLTRGVIYFNQLGLHYFNSTGKNIVLPIGLDVLPRPGEQRGYGVHMKPEDDFNELFPCKSYFWQNEKASIRCQELMGFGKFLFPYDPMVEKIRAMQTYKLYGKDSVEKVISSSEEFTGYTLEQAITMLTDRGCTLLPTTPFHYTKEETEYITERYHKRYPSEFQTQ